MINTYKKCVFVNNKKTFITTTGCCYCPLPSLRSLACVLFVSRQRASIASKKYAKACVVFVASHTHFVAGRGQHPVKPTMQAAYRY